MGKNDLTSSGELFPQPTSNMNEFFGIELKKSIFPLGRKNNFSIVFIFNMLNLIFNFSIFQFPVAII